MSPTQYTALPRTTSSFPLHGYFVQSKRWGERKTPKLTIGRPIAFGGFIDRIRRERNTDKTVASVDIEVANIAYISNRPESSTIRKFSLLLSLQCLPTYQYHTPGADSRVTTSRTRWNYNKSSKQPPTQENSASTSQPTPSQSTTAGKRKRDEHPDDDEEQTASDDDVKKNKNSNID
jgi:hypothetical protein